MNTAIKPITPEREQELVAKLVDFLSSRYDAGNLYDILHHALGMDHSDMESLGFQLRDYYEESCKQKSIAEMKKVPQNLHS